MLSSDENPYSKTIHFSNAKNITDYPLSGQLFFLIIIIIIICFCFRFTCMFIFLLVVCLCFVVCLCM